MGNPVDRQDQANLALDAFWDEITLGRDDDAHDRTLPSGYARTVRLLHRRDATHAPNPSFVERLREELMTQALTTAATTSGATIGPRSFGERRRTRPSSDQSRHDRRFRWLALGELAAVAALIVAMFGTTIQWDRFAAFWKDDSGTTGVSQTVAMYRGDAARTGVLPGPALQGDPGLLWQQEYGHLGWSFYGAPNVADRVIYTLVGQNEGPAPTLNAFEAATGQLKWFVPVGAVEDSYPTIANGVVYIATAGPQRGGSGTDPGYVFAFNAEDGSERWRFLTGGVVGSSPAVVDDTLYVRAFDGTLYAIDTATGNERWRFTVDPSGPPIDQPVVDESSYHLPSPVSPAVVDGVVYAASNTNELFAIDAETGQQLWSFTSDGEVLQTPAVVDGLIYLVAANGFGSYLPGAHGWVYALDATSGEQRWSWTTESNLNDPPAVANGLVYISENTPEDAGRIVALSTETGIPTWTYAAPALIVWELTVVDTTLYVMTIDARLNALDTRTGTEDWRVDLGPGASMTTISDGSIVIGTDDGRLFGLGGMDPTGNARAATPIENGDLSGLPTCDLEPFATDRPLPEGTPAASLVPIRDNQDTGQPAQVLLEEIPEGTPPTDEQLGGIVRALQQMADCNRPGYRERIATLFSDDLLRRVWVQQFLANGNSLADFLFTEGYGDPTPIVNFDNARVLPDGRIGLRNMYNEANEVGRYLVFVEQDGRWLIDEMLEVYPEHWTR